MLELLRVSTFLALAALLVAGKRAKYHERYITFRILPEFKDNAFAIKDVLYENGILDYYFYHFSPAGTLLARFPYGDGFEVDYGNYISPLYTIEEPSVWFESFFPASDIFMDSRFTLVLMDLDPGREKCHAIWVNLSVKESQVVFIKQDSNESEKPGQEPFAIELHLNPENVLVPYVGPQPKQETGIHRYVFVLFRQLNGEQLFHYLRQRENFGSKDPTNSVSNWADYYKLQPVAVNFFTSSNGGLFTKDD